MASRIHRVTLFKIPDPGNQNKLLEAYKVLARDQTKVRPSPADCLRSSLPLLFPYNADEKPLFWGVLVFFSFFSVPCLLSFLLLGQLADPGHPLAPLPQDGKPYIPYLCAGRALEDDRSKGYTVVAKSEFETLEDMRFYDRECSAHAALRKTAATLGLAEPPTSAYFEGAPTVPSA